MPGLDYPFTFKCTGCGEETTVRRSNGVSLNHDPDSIDAVLAVLDNRDWVRDEDEELLLCPHCAED